MLSVDARGMVADNTKVPSMFDQLRPERCSHHAMHCAQVQAYAAVIYCRRPLVEAMCVFATCSDAGYCAALLIMVFLTCMQEVNHWEVVGKRRKTNDERQQAHNSASRDGGEIKLWHSQPNSIEFPAARHA